MWMIPETFCPYMCFLRHAFAGFTTLSGRFCEWLFVGFNIVMNPAFYRTSMASDADLISALQDINKQLILLNEQVRTSNLLRAETVKGLKELSSTQLLI